MPGKKNSKIKEQAHAIKGNSGNIGALHIAILSAKFEEEVLNLAQMNSLITEIEDEFQEVIRILIDMQHSSQVGAEAMHLKY